MNNSTTPELLSEEALKEIETRANAATKGPWEPRGTPPFGDGILIDTVHDGLRGAIASVINPARFMSSTKQQEQKDAQTRADALFIQHSREDIPALCQTVRALRDQLAEEQRRNQMQADTIMEYEGDVAALREQLAQARQSAFRDGRFALMGIHGSTNPDPTHRKGFTAGVNAAIQALEAAARKQP